MNRQASSLSGATDDPEAGGATVYFDGSCPLCTMEISHYAKQVQKNELTFVDVSSARVDLGTDLTVGDAMKRFHVRLPDGSLVSGARAFVALWDTLPRWRWAAKLARFPGVLPMLETGYRLFLPVRPLLSRVASRLGAHPANRAS